MNNYLLLEIGVEELPSRFGQTTLDQIENNLSKLLKEERINFDNIEKYATPRRLTFVIKNLAEKATTDIVKEDLLKEDAEIKLYNGFKEIKSNVESLLLDKKYNEALDAFATLRPLVDNLFDNVMVMDKDEAIKENRLGLLKQIYSTMLTICDLSKIVYK